MQTREDICIASHEYLGKTIFTKSPDGCVQGEVDDVRKFPVTDTVVLVIQWEDQQYGVQPFSHVLQGLIHDPVQVF